MGIFRQFPYSNFHEMNMDEIIKIVRELSDEWDATQTEWATYKDFIDNYFANLNLDEETEKALRVLVNDGTLDPVIDPVIASETATWLSTHITQPTVPAIDTSLTVTGAGADAKVVGDRFVVDENNIGLNSHDISSVKSDIMYYFPILTPGAINVSNGHIVASTSRLYSDLISCDNKYLLVHAPFKVWFVYYNNDGSYAGAGAGWEVGKVSPNPNYDFFRVMVYDSSNAYPDLTNINNQYIVGVYRSDNILEKINATLAETGSYYPKIKTGSFNVNTGALNPTTLNRAISEPIPKALNTITSKTNYDFYVIGYDNNYNFISSSGWISGSYNVPSTYEYYQLMIKNNNISDFTNRSNNFIHIGAGEIITNRVFAVGQYDNVAQVITEAMNFKNSTVIIEPYTHDCITEWENYFGASYFDNIGAGDKGLILENGIKIIGRSGARLKCYYTGNNNYVHSEFSLFNNGYVNDGSGYSIENIIFDTKNIRYVIHDERGSSPIPYKTRYSRCKFVHDNSGSTWQNSRACLGGGFGEHGDVTIEDCIFISIIDSINKDSVAFHNSASSNAQNSLVIKNCYCGGQSTIQLASYGDSTKMSKIMVANCSVGSAIEQYNWDNANNFEYYMINNTVRN